jgi:hypothetical protein
MSCDKLKERYKAQILYHINMFQFTMYTATCIQCGLDTLLNLPFKSIFLIYEFILNTNKWCSVFATSSFNLNITFSSMLSVFELCQHKQGLCLVYILEIYECYFSCIAKHLEFIFHVPIRNTVIKTGQDFKKIYEISHALWLCPFKSMTTAEML